MADTVRYLMEEMIPELEDMEERGYFSKTEVKSIVKHRRDFEYKLARKASTRQDYVRYAEYELKLDKLRSIRGQALNISDKKSRADLSMIKRIHSIYDRATHRFKGDLRLWMAWLKFCDQCNATKRTSAVLARALALLPRVPGLWTHAAAWEFNSNGNVTAARAMMQRGLRACPHSTELWVEYFRMELLYAQKLVTRRKILGIGGAGGKPPAQGEVPEPADEGDVEEAAVQSVLSGAAAQIVLRHACSAHPQSLDMRRQMLEVLSAMRFKGVKAIRRALYAGILADFPDRPDAMALVARGSPAALLPGAGKASLRSCDAAFQAASEQLPTAGMFDEHVRFLQEAAAAPGSTGGEQDVHAFIDPRIRAVCAAAAEAGAASDYTAALWVKLAAELGPPSEAAAAAATACDAMPSSCAAWRTRIQLQCSQLGWSSEGEVAAIGDAKAAAPPLDQQQTVLGVMEEAFQGVGEACSGAAGPLWAACLHLAAVNGAGHVLQQLCGRLLHQVTGAPRSDGLEATACAALEAVWHTGGPAAGRAFCAEVKRLPSPGPAFWRQALTLEGGVAGVDQGGDAAVEALLEHALAAHGAQDCELWLMAVRRHEACNLGTGQVYWRAVKALHDPDEFIQRMKGSEA